MGSAHVTLSMAANSVLMFDVPHETRDGTNTSLEALAAVIVSAHRGKARCRGGGLRSRNKGAPTRACSAAMRARAQGSWLVLRTREKERMAQRKSGSYKGGDLGTSKGNGQRGNQGQCWILERVGCRAGECTCWSWGVRVVDGEERKKRTKMKNKSEGPISGKRWRHAKWRQRADRWMQRKLIDAVTSVQSEMTDSVRLG